MVWDRVEKLAVTSLLVNVATTSGISAVVYELAISMVDGLAASKFPVRSVLPELCLLRGLPVRVTSDWLCVLPSKSSNASTRLQIGVE